MDILIQILRLVISIVLALVVGKLVAKINLPSILGWLITGIVIGPYALGILDNSVLNATWFSVAESIFQCVFGLMIGTELIWNRMKRAGTQIVVTTITESLGTFVAVSAVLGFIFYFSGVPVYLAFIMGAIALATAPAPSLSVVDNLKTDGPVTRTLIPMAALDDLFAALVFFLTIAFVTAHISTSGLSVPVVLLLVFSPVAIGIVTGYITGLILRRTKTNKSTTIAMIIMLLVSTLIGAIINSMLPAPVINFMLIGMSFSTVFSNMIEQEKLDKMMVVMNPIIGLSMVPVILDLAAPLDYRLIFSAGIYTVVYIVSRAIGKYFGAYFGASVTHSDPKVKKYLGFTLLPHSGVSLVFSGIAISVLAGPAPECAEIIQGTIAAAAVINEIIAVFMAKKGFEWAGEIGKADEVGFYDAKGED